MTEKGHPRGAEDGALKIGRSREDAEKRAKRERAPRNGPLLRRCHASLRRRSPALSGEGPFDGFLAGQVLPFFGPASLENTPFLKTSFKNAF
mmetsp:Transcript_31224/g.105054  ORF Transcript_31224/g.105054 Transcript_31224/m.105054 type:complete len:92 (+) Transcript_31224:880-1155(+)